MLSPSFPSESTLTRTVVPACKSRTNTSLFKFVSSGTRLLARLSNATQRPPAEIEGQLPPLSAGSPSELTLARSVIPACRSRTNTSANTLGSTPARLLALLSKAT